MCGLPAGCICEWAFLSVLVRIDNMHTCAFNMVQQVRVSK